MISAYVIASPVKQGKTLNKFSKKVPISSSRLTHEIAQLELESLDLMGGLQTAWTRPGLQRFALC